MLQTFYVYVNTLLADRKGVTALEYGVLAAAIIGAIATVAGTIGTDLGALFTSLASDITR